MLSFAIQCVGLLVAVFGAFMIGVDVGVLACGVAIVFVGLATEAEDS